MSRIDSLNTRLTLILGFEAAFIKFAADLPDHFDVLKWQNPLLTGGCNSCLILKLSTFVALIAATYYALRGIFPIPGIGFLDPIDQLEDDSVKIKAEFQKKVIRLLSEHSIPDLKNILMIKSESLRRSLIALGFASTASAIDLMISAIFIGH